MEQRKINETFLDTENFTPGKKLKCVEDVDNGDGCDVCEYDGVYCDAVSCSKNERTDCKDVYFIELKQNKNRYDTWTTIIDYFRRIILDLL